MKRNGAILLAAVLLTTLLARLDDGATSFRDIVRLENVPAFVGYTAVFYLVLLGVVSAISLVRARRLR